MQRIDEQHRNSSNGQKRPWRCQPNHRSDAQSYEGGMMPLWPDQAKSAQKADQHHVFEVKKTGT
jgi:hypothetical protein